MKKITLLVCLLAFALIASAQQTNTTRVDTARQTVIHVQKTDTVKVYQQPVSYDNTVKLGIRLAPGLAFNSAQGEEGASDINSNGAVVRMSGGLIADFFLAETYAFSTGLWYTIKRSGFRNVPFPASQSTDPTLIGNSEYNLQYLQVPITLKLFTNDIAPDTRVYFQLGGTFDVKLAEKAKDRNTNALYLRAKEQDTKVYKPIDLSLLLGAGIEFRVSEQNYLFGGITYNRGLINAIRGSLKDDLGSDFTDNFKSLNSLVSLEIGLKF